MASRANDYSPLPLAHEDNAPTSLYNAPRSQGPSGSSFSIPAVDRDGAPYTDEIGIPLGAQPRFLGQALYDDANADVRTSIATSHNMYPSSGRVSASTEDSIYNPYADGSYHDEPGFFVGEQPMRRSNKRRSAYASSKSRRKKRIFLGVGALILVLVVIGIVLYFTVFKKKSTSGNSGSSNTSSSNNTGSSPQSKVAIVTGGDGSTVTAEDGTTFTYTNPYGGNWYWDINDPFNNGARAQSWSPGLNETFNFGVDKIRGVNIGGWLVTEPFIVPGLYQTVQASAPSDIQVVDEHTLLQAGGQSALEDHYKTFITEQDFMQIAAAGLNFVRIPLGYWAIEVLDGEGFLPKTSWTYFLKAIQWARKYGLRINLDLHALPGSQNGWNHSGRLGSYNVLFGPMGIANAQRSLDYVRILAEFISQPEYKDIVVMFGITNEPQGTAITQNVLARYYLQAYNNVRLASGIGQGNGPFVSLHDGFLGTAQWKGFLPNSDRVSLDMHPYLCFQGQSADPITQRKDQPCDAWGAEFNNTMTSFGFVVAGEFSNAVVDCGLYVNGVGLGTRFEGTYHLDGDHPNLGDCATDWLDWEHWNDTTKAAYKTFAKSSMDALQNWFFWTWKIGNSTAGRVEAPHWSYQLGLQEGWMPTDPREAVGQCGNKSPFNGPLSAWQTGGAGAGAIPTDVSNALAWPPPSIVFAGGVTSPANALPTYAPAGSPMTLPGPAITPASGEPSATKSVDVGSGWANVHDTAGMMQPLQGCSYLDPWIGSSVSPPSPLCTNPAAARAAAMAESAPVVTERPLARR
ncbi:Glycoside hydrolase [Mycena venus]|uniref:glucan 1,3-beta-glucosidase n=1 Tax=Mycena venus TaxID=2733690 RepID=A0A8H6XCQ1_9AGAR|nr:Glycoside hydrolase [Mycena venus]